MSSNTLIIYILMLAICICAIIIVARNLNSNKMVSTEPLCISKLNEPNVRIENATQFFYINLLKNLKLNQNKKLLKLRSPCIKKKYIDNTTTELMKENLNPITKIILDSLNKGNQYKFIKTNYGNILELKDKKGVYNFIYEVFVQDVKNIIMLQLKVNVLVFPDNNIKKYFGNDMVTCTEITTSAFPVYNIGIPAKYQYIPLPTQVIPTAGDVLSDGGIKYPRPIKPKYVYINRLKILNSTLVVNPNMKCLTNFVSGKPGKSPEFTYVVGDHNPYIEKDPVLMFMDYKS